VVFPLGRLDLADLRNPIHPLTRSCDKRVKCELNRDEAWARSFLPEHQRLQELKGAVVQRKGLFPRIQKKKKKKRKEKKKTSIRRVKMRVPIFEDVKDEMEEGKTEEEDENDTVSGNTPAEEGYLFL